MKNVEKKCKLKNLYLKYLFPQDYLKIKLLIQRLLVNYYYYEENHHLPIY